MNEAVLDSTPYILTGHDSLAKHITNAELAYELGKFAAITTCMAHQTLSSLGYGVFFQERVGMNGKLFDMPKIQTMESTKTPHTPDNKKNIRPAAQFVRNFGFDEFIQLCLVSTDPFVPRDMSAVSHRPQTEEELDTMNFVMGKAGESHRFDSWYKDIYCSKHPGIVGIESFLDRVHEPDTYDYFSKRIELGERYHEKASPIVDYLILKNVIALGEHSLSVLCSKLEPTNA